MKNTGEEIKKIYDQSQKLLQQSIVKNRHHKELLKIFVETIYLQSRFEKHHLVDSRYYDDYILQFIVQTWPKFFVRQNAYDIIVVDHHVSQQFPVHFVSLLADDCPFLIETIRLLLDDLNLSASFELHPNFNVMRNENGELVDFEDTYGVLPGFKKEMVYLIAFDKKTSDHLLSQFIENLHHRVQEVQKLVQDFPLFLRQSADIADLFLLQKNNPKAIAVGSFLSWLNQNNFVFLGSRVFQTDDEGEKNQSVDDGCKGDGVFGFEAYANMPELMLCKNQSSAENIYGVSVHQSFGVYSPYISIRRSDIQSVIHRRSRYCLIEIQEHGNKSIRQFIGLFTRQFYHTPHVQIPILNNQLDNFKGFFSFDSKSYEEKFFESVLSLIPNDEMYFLSPVSLLDLMKKVLYKPNESAVHMTHNENSLHTDIMIFLPGNQLSPEIKSKIVLFFESEFDGCVISNDTYTSTCPFAYIHLVLSHREISTRPDFDIDRIEDTINMLCHSWQENFDQQWHEFYPTLPRREQIRHVLFEKQYQQIFSIERGIKDAQYAIKTIIHAPKKEVEIIIEGDNSFTLQVFSKQERVSLSVLMPVFESLGIEVLREAEFSIKVNKHNCYLQNFDCQSLYLTEKNYHEVKDAFQGIYNHTIERDVLNTLVLTASLDMRSIIIVRALIRAMRHMNFPASIEHIQNIVVMYPSIITLYCQYFNNKFNPKRPDDWSNNLVDLDQQIHNRLRDIPSNNHDRILRHLYILMQAVMRTNTYLNKEYVSFKFNPAMVPGLPLPLPQFEIYVYAPFVEGIHLRGGKVARGGIRWSDRPEDFRMEILGLLKAQNVKNSIIVPLGAKGGFIARRYDKLLQNGVKSKALKEEVIRCYQIFIRALLDVTDNIIDHQTQTPVGIIAYDDFDPYLVVAADKGTAQFSDYANDISLSYNFWLGDAFASGGSEGYDHKKMAITSKGAWISVLEHLKKINIDPETDSFTVIGVGDMSGDVFGNGMLRSQNIKLIAAFDHRHIFIDPNPCPQISFKERERIFNLNESSWGSYNLALLSHGGAIISRTMKEIQLSDEAIKALGISKDTSHIFTSEEIIQHILMAPVDVLWFGGIGTYVKSSDQSHESVNDPVNNAVRINASDLRVKVIGEGANLAMTQKARVEFNFNSGYVNTDAIDNSAGVSCSDHEVNIKILCQQLTDKNLLTNQERHDLLKSMKTDVASLVLCDNVKQNEVLTMMYDESAKKISQYQDLVFCLMNDTLQPLDLSLEFLPTIEQLQKREQQRQGLARPELAVLLAYSKISVFKHLMKEASEDENWAKDHYISVFENDLKTYFPTILQEKYSEEIMNHKLAIEIIATILSNEIVNKLGPVEAFGFFSVFDSSKWNILKNFKVINHVFKDYLIRLDFQDQMTVLQQLMAIHQKYPDPANGLLITINVPEYATPDFILIMYMLYKKGHYDIFDEDKLKSMFDFYVNLNNMYAIYDVYVFCGNLLAKDIVQRKTRLFLLDEWFIIFVNIFEVILKSKKSKEKIKSYVDCEPMKEIRSHIINKKNDPESSRYDFAIYAIKYIQNMITKNVQ